MPLVVLASIGAWWLFEWYNAPRFWRGGADQVGLWWQYHGLEPDPWLRRVGYDWSFATIFPALFLTAAVLRATVFARARVAPWRPPRGLLRAATAIGAVLTVLPAADRRCPDWCPWSGAASCCSWSRSTTGAVGRRGWARWPPATPRWCWRSSPRARVCGVLWEFWNYWALPEWTYTVPYVGHAKIFEMPGARLPRLSALRARMLRDVPLAARRLGDGSRDRAVL